MAKYYELHLRYPGFYTKAITLSFDDGHTEDRKMVEIINRYGIKCTFNLNGGVMAGYGHKVQAEELNELYQGHEIACHTYTHPHLDKLDLGGIAYQIVKDREALESITGKITQGFAYPYGLHETAGMIDCIQNCGIRYGRTVASHHKFELPEDYLRWNPTCWQGDAAVFELAEKFFKPDERKNKPLLLFYLWGHSFEFKDNWERLEQLCETFGQKENVWYATNMEIIDYISAFKALRRSANGKIVCNPTNVDVYVEVCGKQVILKSGETTVLE